MNALGTAGTGVLALAALSFYGLLRRERRRCASLEGARQAERQSAQQRLHDVQTENHRLFSLFQALYGFDGSSDPLSALPRFAEAAARSMGQLSGAGEVVFLYANRVTRELEPLAAQGFSPEQTARCRVLLGEGVIGQGAHAGGMVTLGRLAAALPPYTWPGLLFPLPVAGRACGLLVVSRPKGEGFTNETTSLLALLAHQIAILLSGLELSSGALRSQDEAIQALARAVGARDRYTQDHSDRTRALVQAVGRECQLPSQLINQIERGALLHDLGKVGIADEILKKTGKLSAEEYAEMKKHPAIGYRILEAIPALKAVATIVLYHQEWFNGEGYPEGLAGEEIPLGARLVSVIDAWDAMTSNRPYCSAMPAASAAAELRRQAGTQFDPKMVDAFLRVVERLEREGVPVTEPPAAAERPAPAHA